MIRVRFFTLAALLGLFAVSPLAGAVSNSAEASSKRQSLGKMYAGSPRRSRRRAQVRGFSSSVGGYSYSIQDTINTYSNNRSNFGGANSYRDPSLDTQTRAGPFDHGWFFDSGINPQGGNSPYLQ